jgi:hypothetical protein
MPELSTASGEIDYTAKKDEWEVSPLSMNFFCCVARHVNVNSLWWRQCITSRLVRRVNSSVQKEVDTGSTAENKEMLYSNIISVRNFSKDS